MKTEDQIQTHSRYRQKSGQPSHIHNYSNKGADKPGKSTDIADKDADVDGRTDPGTQ